MKKSLWLFSFFVLILAILPCPAQSAPAYPTKPIEMIIGFGPGGAADVTARLPRPKRILGIHAGRIQKIPAPGHQDGDPQMI